MGHYNSFLVRVWTEDGENIVRGYIQHVGSQDTIHFRNMDKMMEFMMNHLGWHITGDEGVEQPLPIPHGDESGL